MMDARMTDTGCSANEKSPDAAHWRRWRGVISLLMLVILLGTVFGCYWERDWLRRRFVRMDVWRALSISISELLAVFWFLQFFVSHCLLGRPPKTSVIRPGMRWGGWGTFLLSMALAGAIDLGSSFQWMVAERMVYRDEAVRTMATAESVSPYRKSSFHMRTYYDVMSTYQDRAGKAYRTKFVFYEDPRQAFPHGQPELLGDLRARRVPFRISVRYDPARPLRSWPELGYWGEDGESTLQEHSLFLAICYLSSIGFILVPVMRHWKELRTEYLPWWCEFLKFMPLMMHTTAILLTGSIEEFGRTPL